MTKKTTKMPLVSVIMPAYNCQEYIDEALQSLFGQTYSNLEIIVVDDKSSDATWRHIQNFAKRDGRVRPYRNATHANIKTTLNFAIKQCEGVYIARMDADDVRELDSIEKQVTMLENNPSLVLVGGSSLVCDENMNVLNKREYPNDDATIKRKLFRYSPFTGAAVVVRAGALKKTLFQFDMAEDYESYFRLAKFGEFANLKDVVYRIRTHRNSASQSRTRYQEKVTLYVRVKAVFEYGFTMTFGDKIYFIAQLVTMYIMPSSFRFWLFNKIRRVMK